MSFKKRVRVLINISIAVILFCSFQKHYAQQVKAPIFKAYINKWEKVGGENHLLITTTLTNNSDDTISYCSMSCSWQDAYCVDIKQNMNAGKFEIIQSSCDKNFPVVIKIPAHTTQAATLQLMTTNNTALHNINFRVGFNFITFEGIDGNNEGDYISGFTRLQKRKNIIWSDTLRLK